MGAINCKIASKSHDLKIVTSQTLQRMDRSDEYEVAFGDNIFESGNLRDKAKRCQKNPGHEGFTSVKDFGLAHLPPKLQHQDVLEHIKKLADCIVLIKTYFVSETRPARFPPDSQFRGMGCAMTGTGYCYSVSRWDNTAWSDQFCECQACKKSSQPKTSWWVVYVKTAAHVVYDAIEAASTEVVFFYNDTDSQTFKIHGTSVEHVDVDKDSCGLEFVVHDGEMDNVMYKLKGLHQDVVRVGVELREKYWEKGSDDHCVIISHPHGCTKQISVGKRLKDEEDSDGGWVVCYDAPTCPGTSGAIVPLFYRVMFLGAPHSKCGKDGIGRSGRYVSE